MEDHPKYEPTVESTVLPHPDLDGPLEREQEVQTVPPPAAEPPPASPKKTCCPLEQAFIPPPPFELPPMVPPCALLDVRDLSATLMGTFALGAAVAFALAYFSRPKVVQAANA